MERQASHSNRSQVASRADAIALAAEYFDSGGFFKDVSRRVAISTDSGAPGARLAALRYLADEVEASLQPLGFSTQYLENPIAPDCPFLFAERIQDPALPTLLVYAHGDVAAAAYRGKKAPARVDVQGDRWIGPGIADSKAQHSANLAAIAHVIRARGGELNYNIKVLMEMGEEQGSPGLQELCLEQGELLKADVMLASDGSRAACGRPTVVLGSRGSFSCVLQFRDRREATLVTGMLMQAVRGLEADTGSPTQQRTRVLYTPPYGLSGAASSTLRVGRIERVGKSETSCRVRLEYLFVEPDAAKTIFSRLSARLASLGFPNVELRPSDMSPVAPAITNPDNSWVRFVSKSLEAAELGPVVLPCFDGITTSDIFMTTLGLPTIWIPHAPPSCGNHGPAEYVLASSMREGLQLMTGLLWDLNACGLSCEIGRKSGPQLPVDFPIPTTTSVLSGVSFDPMMRLGSSRSAPRWAKART